jgi:hypothetical protein
MKSQIFLLILIWVTNTFNFNSVGIQNKEEAFLASSLFCMMIQKLILIFFIQEIVGCISMKHNKGTSMWQKICR